MPLLQSVGMPALAGTVAVTLLSLGLWRATRRQVWGRSALLAPAAYLGALVLVALASPAVKLAPGSAQRFCGLYLDCHLSVRVERVEEGSSEWRATLVVANDARRATLAPVGLAVELLRPDSGAVRLVPLGPDPSAPLAPGDEHRFTVTFAPPINRATPSLRVTEGYGVDRVIEGLLLGDDDALGRHRVTLGLELTRR